MFTVALTNPQVKRLLSLFNKYNINHVTTIHPHPQQQLTTISQSNLIVLRL